MSDLLSRLGLTPATMSRFASAPITLEGTLIASARLLKGRQGRRGLPEHIVAAMYQDYLKLHSLTQVGKKYGRTRQSVYCIFRCHGLKCYAKNWQPRIVHGGRVFTPGKSGYYRATSGDREPLHHRLWLDAGNTIPPGWQVSFKDGDKSNFAPENLFCDSLIGVTLYHQRRLGLRKYKTAEELRRAKCRNAIACYQRRRVKFLAAGRTATGKIRARKPNFVHPDESPYVQDQQRRRQLKNTRENVLANYHRRALKLAEQGLTTRGSKPKRRRGLVLLTPLESDYRRFRESISGQPSANWDISCSSLERADE